MDNNNSTNTSNVTRRNFLIGGISLAIIAGVVGIFRWKSAKQVSDWTLNLPNFQPGTTFDLTETLPASVRKGGIFSVDPRGKSLPTNVTLSQDGKLNIGTDATGNSEGVIFNYAEPN